MKLLLMMLMLSQSYYDWNDKDVNTIYDGNVSLNKVIEYIIKNESECMSSARQDCLLRKEILQELNEKCSVNEISFISFNCIIDNRSLERSVVNLYDFYRTREETNRILNRN